METAKTFFTVWKIPFSDVENCTGSYRGSSLAGLLFIVKSFIFYWGLLDTAEQTNVQWKGLSNTAHRRDHQICYLLGLIYPTPVLKKANPSLIHAQRVGPSVALSCQPASLCPTGWDNVSVYPVVLSHHHPCISSHPVKTSSLMSAFL